MNHAERLTKARIALRLDQPFFGSLILQLKPKIDPNVRTACTDGRSLWFNPKYMDRLNDGQLRTVLAHEVLHPAFGHPFRLGNRKLKLANRAADYVVNGILDNYNLDAIKKKLPIPFPWPTAENGEPDVLLDHQYDGMSFEEVYSILEKQQPPPQPQGGKQKPQPGNGAGQGQPQPGDGDGGEDSDGPPSPGEFIAPQPEPGTGTDPAEAAKKAEIQWKQAVKQATAISSGQGMLPAGMDREINAFLDPAVPWREVLRTLLTSTAKDDYTWTRPNRRYASGGIILPSLHSPRMGRIVIAIDTSGSIGQDELNEFMAEIRGILFDVRPSTLITCQCDAEIHEWEEHDNPFDEVDIQLKGGGGTDFRPVFERADQEVEPIAALVYLTDLMGDFPELPPAYPVIWACNNDRTAPYGETVHIK